MFFKKEKTEGKSGQRKGKEGEMERERKQERKCVLNNSQ